jgi:hypothetical protein
VRTGDLLIAEFSDGTGIHPTDHIPDPYPASPHNLSDCPCESCEECDAIDAWTLDEHTRLADTAWRYICLAPSEDGEPCTIVLRNRPMAIIPADVVSHAKAAAAITPILPSACSEAHAAELEARQAIRDMWNYGFPRCPLTQYAEAAGRAADAFNS